MTLTLRLNRDLVVINIWIFVQRRLLHQLVLGQLMDLLETFVRSTSTLVMLAMREVLSKVSGTLGRED